jgi:hypothetical protein
MIALGVLILVIVAVASVTAFLRGGETIRIDLHWFTVKTTAGVVFLAGAVALALVVLGLSLIWEGLKRGRKRRKETKALRQRAEAGERLASTAGQPDTGATAQQPGQSPVTPPRGPDDHFDSAPRDR